MTIRRTGFVGIGTSSSAVLLEVEDTSIDGSVLRLQDSDGTCDYNPESSDGGFACSSDSSLKV